MATEIVPGVYNLDINKTSGTMTSWFSANGQGSRIIFVNEGTSGELLNVYVDANQKVNLAVRNNAGIYTNVITTDETVGSNEWNFAAAKWQFDGSNLTCTLYLNSKAYTANVTSFEDFTGMQTAVGSNISGIYSLTGLFKKFSYSSSALSANEILSMYYNSRVNYSYDALGRMNSKTTNTEIFSYATEYTYVPGTNTNATTSKVASIKNNNGVPITYEYDANGNISKVTQGIMNIIYLYNELNELIQEDNQVLNKTIIYSYDVGGNLTSKLEIPYGGGSNTTITYSYNTVWKDKLISYNGKPITYDALGNPLTYDGYTYIWEEGRQLKSIIGNGKNISYKYNDAGIRTVKTVDGVTTKYYLLGSMVIHETNLTDIIYYTYGSSGSLVSMNLNGVEYYYIRNVQGDIIGLYDKTGTQVVGYIYDTWGKLISITGTLASSVGVKNPYRYRGYRYDTETGLYYLQSRYYNPSWGRFLNPDITVGSVGELTGANGFAYCKNNPTTLKDPSGFRPIYTAGVETDDMREASLATMSKVNMSNYQKKHNVKAKPKAKNYNYESPVAGVVSSIGLAAASVATIGQTTTTIITNVSRSVVTPIKLSAYPQVSNFLITYSLVSLTYSVRANFSGEYITEEAWARTAIDVGSTAAVIIFGASGGWAAVGIGLGIGVIAEGGKGLVNLWLNRA
ncbi:RHS repeat-associated core domain-containing protein [Clostridium sp.]|uniref:RHS repeat-associated core domain-containing protein n=1 Tax=Clostridium sp. TaxID=1506 RepID=UPI003D6CF2AC